MKPNEEELDLNIHIHIHHPDLDTLIKRIDKMDAATQAALVRLQDAVAAETTVENSVIALLNGLSAQILDLKNQTSDPAVAAALQAAADLVTANTTKLSDAVTANTPTA